MIIHHFLKNILQILSRQIKSRWILSTQIYPSIQAPVPHYCALSSDISKVSLLKSINLQRQFWSQDTQIEMIAPIFSKKFLCKNSCFIFSYMKWKDNLYNPPHLNELGNRISLFLQTSTNDMTSYISTFIIQFHKLLFFIS